MKNQSKMITTACGVATLLIVPSLPSFATVDFVETFDTAPWVTQAGGALPTSGNSVTTDPTLSDTDPYAGAAYEVDEGPNGVHGETLVGTSWQWIQGSSNLGDSPEEIVFWNDQHTTTATPTPLLPTMNGTAYVGFNRKVGLMLNLTALGLDAGTENLTVSFDYAWGNDARNTGLHYAVLDGAVDPSWSGGVNLYQSFDDNDLGNSYGELTATDETVGSGTITLSNLDVSAATGDVYFALMTDLWNNRVAAIDNIIITSVPSVPKIKITGVTMPSAARLRIEFNGAPSTVHEVKSSADLASSPFTGTVVPAVDGLETDVNGDGFVEIDITLPGSMFYQIQNP